MLIQFLFWADTSDNRDNTHSTLSHYDSDHEDYHDLYHDIDQGCDQTDKFPVPMIGNNGNKTGKQFIYSLFGIPVHGLSVPNMASDSPRAISHAGWLSCYSFVILL